jgi:hypothetical protein
MFQQNHKKYCDWCAKYATKCCSKCNRVYYCSKDCQINDWNRGIVPHKLVCNTMSIFVVENYEKLRKDGPGYIYIEYASFDLEKANNWKELNFKKYNCKLHVNEFFAVKPEKRVIYEEGIMYYQITDSHLKPYLFFSEEQAKELLKSKFPIRSIVIGDDYILRYDKNDSVINPLDRRYGKNVSCLNFIEKFKNMYPKAKVDVYDNKNEDYLINKIELDTLRIIPDRNLIPIEELVHTNKNDYSELTRRLSNQDNALLSICDSDSDSDDYSYGYCKENKL